MVNYSAAFEVMTDREVVDMAISLAGEFYVMHGYIHREGFEYWKSPHPQEQLMFEMAAKALEVTSGTEVWECIANLEEDE